MILYVELKKIQPTYGSRDPHLNLPFDLIFLQLYRSFSFFFGFLHYSNPLFTQKCLQYPGLPSKIFDKSTYYNIFYKMIFYKNGYSQPISYASYYPRPPKSTFIPLYSPNDPQELAVIQLLQKYGKKPIDYGTDKRNGLEIGIVYGKNVIVKRYTSPNTPQYAIVYLAAYFSPEEVFDKFEKFMIELQNRLKDKEFAIDCEQFAVIKELLKRNGYVMSGEGLKSQITFGQSKRNTIKKQTSMTNGYGLISNYLTKYFPLYFPTGQQGSIEQTYQKFDHLVLQLNNIILKEAEKK